MDALISIPVFVIDSGLVAATAWLGVCAGGLHRRGLVEASLGWLLLALAWIAGSGVLLGLGGGLGRTGFLFIHAVVLGVVLFIRRSGRADGRSCLDWLAAWGRLLRGGTAEGRLAGGLILILLVLAVLSARVEPIVFDALTYRLSRIGAWLQDGTIRHFATDDPRLNYMPVAPDVVIAWLLGATKTGFYLAPWSQLAGGCLLLGATFGLARTGGLTRLQALGSVALVLGMANVAVQFTTVQSDLFTAGAFAAAYLLWHRALLRGEGSWVGGVGVALAFGSKGTMFYLAPGAALWVGWLVWRHRDKGRALMPTAAGLAVAALILVAPGCWRNQVAYGSLFGPRDAVVLHHGEFASVSHYAEKVWRNLGTSAVQLLEPNAQPSWLQAVCRRTGERLAGRMSAQADAYVFIGQSRRDQLERVLRLPEPDADVVTCGVLGVALFLGGLGVAVAAKKREGAAQILVWGGGVLVYLVVQHALVQWHHWAFRFMVLAAPWVAVAGAWGLGGLPRKVRVAAWAVLLISALEVFVTVQARASQAAWPALTRPERSASYFYYRTWRGWAGQLDQRDAPLRLALPIDRALASFYRLDPPRRVELTSLAGLSDETAEAAVRDRPGWLVVPVDRFQSHEGRVLGITGPLGLAAYRKLEPGERPRPMIYANQLIGHGETMRRLLMVRTWADAPVHLELFNPAVEQVRFDLRTPSGQVAGVLAAGERRTWEIPVPPEVLATVTIDFPRGAAPDVTATAVMVRLTPD